MKHLATGLLFAALGPAGPMVAQSQDRCPGPRDRGQPIAVRFESGLMEVHSTKDGQTFSIEAFEAGQPIYRLEVAHGTHLLSYVEVYDGQADEGTRVTYDYGIPVARMPVPAPGARWQSGVRVTDNDGTATEAQVQAYGVMTDVTIGTCRYDMIPVLIAYDSADLYVEQINYLPELGIGYLVDSQTETDPGGPIPASAIWVAD